VSKRSAKRTLLLNLRRTVHAHRRFAVEPLGEGRERLTCTTCGAVTEQRVGGDDRHGATSSSVAVMNKLARYRAGLGSDGSPTNPNRRSTVSGTCQKCTETERNTRYPFPEEKP
jgi:hypothetical protein